MPPKVQAPPVVETIPEEKVPEVPQFGFGKFEYKDQTCYVGNWRFHEGVKMKHGHGKITFPGVNGGKGCEEYDGDWEDDKMHGSGRFQFTSGAVYQGAFKNNKMHGLGKIVNADGTSYEGEWCDNLMHGEG
jgi:hypothetical protein